MKLNKKGTTLIELIISIALISVVLVFMIKLLIDVNNLETNNVYAKDNQLLRAEIIRTIENDIKDKIITNIGGNSGVDSLSIVFTFESGIQSTLNATKDTINYKNSIGETRKWTMKEGSINTSCVKIYSGGETEAGKAPEDIMYPLTIILEVYTTNDNNKKEHNNSLDDIQISYLSKGVDLSSISIANNCEK